MNEPSDPAEPEELARLRRENLRAARRIRQLESTLSGLERMRDTNVRLMERLTDDLEAERARSHELLLNVLPQPIIDRLNAGERLIADHHEDVAIVFSDLVGFTSISAAMGATDLVRELNWLFSRFDAACVRLGVEKIKTIGDAYFAAAGLPGMGSAPVPSTDGADRYLGPAPVVAAAALALEMRDEVETMGPPWRLRIGIHVGEVMAGVIGTRKYVYDLWGDAVNVASRLETTAPPGTIQVSAAVVAALGDGWRLDPHGPVELKGKGATETWLLLGRSE